MKNLLILILVLATTSAPCLSQTVNQRDKYGHKVGSYKQTSYGYVEYDKHNQVKGYYRQKSNCMVKYDKYGTKITTYTNK